MSKRIKPHDKKHQRSKTVKNVQSRQAKAPTSRVESPVASAPRLTTSSASTLTVYLDHEVSLLSWRELCCREEAASTYVLDVPSPYDEERLDVNAEAKGRRIEISDVCETVLISIPEPSRINGKATQRIAITVYLIGDHIAFDTGMFRPFLLAVTKWLGSTQTTFDVEISASATLRDKIKLENDTVGMNDVVRDLLTNPVSTEAYRAAFHCQSST